MSRLNALLSRKVVRHLMIIGGYLLVALVITWPALTTLSTHFIGSETGDSYEMARHIWWFGYALQQGEPLLYQTYLGYPAGISGTVFTTVPLQYLPAALFALLMPLPLAYNLHVLLWMALNGWSMVILMRYLLADDRAWLPALLSGLIFMAHPIFQGHLHEGHGGLMVMWPVPLYVWALLHLIRARTHGAGLRWLAASVGFFYLSTTGHILQAVYVLLPLTGVVWLVQVWRRDWQAVGRLMGMGLLAALLSLVMVWPALSESLAERAYTETGGYVTYSADALALVSPSFFHPLFNALLSYPRDVLGTNLGEGAAYLGLVAGGLALTGLFAFQKARQWLLVGGVAWVLSLGPLLKVLNQPLQIRIGEYSTYIPLPFALLQQIPGFNLARTPGRFTFTLALALAILAGFGAAYMLRKRPGRIKYAIAGLLSVLILFEYQFFWPMPTLPGAVPQAVTEIRTRDDVQAVFNVPHQHLLAAKDALYLQTAHHTPLIAGQITRQTPVNPAKLALLQQTLNPALLQSAGVGIVIHHRQHTVSEAPNLAERLDAQFGAPFFQNEQLALYNVPETTTPPPDILLSLLHAAGRTQQGVSVPLYVARPGWYQADVTLTEARPTLHLRLNDRLLNTYQPQIHTETDTAITIEQPLYITDSGYQSLQLTLDPPCPTTITPPLTCQGMTYDMTLSEAAGEGVPGTAFADGIVLRAAQIAQNNAQVNIRLAWAFEQPRSETDVRFVHLINAEGELVAQEDTAPGHLAAGATRTEQVTFSTEGLSAGVYRLRVGWYAYHPADETFTNYAAVSGEAAVILGEVQIVDASGR